MPMGIITLEDVLEGTETALFLTCYHLDTGLLELIGEEIYDEFDVEGGHASYVPPDILHNHNRNHNAAATAGSSTLRKKVSAPQLAVTDTSQTGTPQTMEASLPSSTVEGQPNRSLTSTPVLRPIALKGLSFITNRSRSAPPTPHDAKAASATSPATVSEAAVSASSPRATSPVIAESISNQGSTTLSPLTPALEDDERGENQIPDVSDLETIVDLPHLTFSTSQEEVDSDHRRVKQPPPNAIPPANSLPGSVAASRSGSPAPPLEVILLDRKRRLAASGSQAAPPGPSTPAANASALANPRVGTPLGMKGQRFKSSPLGGGERTGVVVAEKVREELIRSQRGSQEDVRIPDGKDKSGPDKISE